MNGAGGKQGSGGEEKESGVHGRLGISVRNPTRGEAWKAIGGRQADFASGGSNPRDDSVTTMRLIHGVG